MDNLAVPHNVLQALDMAKLHTLESILEYSQSDLVRRTGLKNCQVQGLLQIASESLLGNALLTSALDMYNKETKLNSWGRLSTGCPVIDNCLGGGILPAALTDLTGTSAAGKTQLCLQLSLMVQLPLEYGGMEGKVVYISTEGPLPTGRLKQLSSAIASKYSSLKDAVSTTTLMDNILIHQCVDVFALMTLLRHKLPTLLDRHSDIRLIVIDSIAALFRSQYETSEMLMRSDDMKTVISLLRGLIHSYRITIICTNQITANLSHTDDSRTRVQPALGLLWSNCVNARIILERNETVDDNERLQEAVVMVPRVLKVDMAPHLPVRTVHYCINNNGVFGIMMKT